MGEATHCRVRDRGALRSGDPGSSPGPAALSSSKTLGRLPVWALLMKWDLGCKCHRPTHYGHTVNVSIVSVQNPDPAYKIKSAFEDQVPRSMPDWQGHVSSETSARFSSLELQMTLRPA